MTTKILLEHGQYVISERRWWYSLIDPPNMLFYDVADSNIDGLIGKRIAIPINSVILFVINWK
jgi:hypothetical protein